WLDALCLSGRLAWARLSPPSTDREVVAPALVLDEDDDTAEHGSTMRRGSRVGPIRTTPIALGPRQALATWRRQQAEDAAPPRLSTESRLVRDHLASRGASFLSEIVTACGLLPGQVESALGELVAEGLATCDSFTGLRLLLRPPD